MSQGVSLFIQGFSLSLSQRLQVKGLKKKKEYVYLFMNVVVSMPRYERTLLAISIFELWDSELHFQQTLERMTDLYIQAGIHLVNRAIPVLSFEGCKSHFCRQFSAHCSC